MPALVIFWAIIILRITSGIKSPGGEICIKYFSCSPSKFLHCLEKSWPENYSHLVIYINFVVLIIKIVSFVMKFETVLFKLVKNFVHLFVIVFKVMVWLKLIWLLWEMCFLKSISDSLGFPCFYILNM